MTNIIVNKPYPPPFQCSKCCMVQIHLRPRQSRFSQSSSADKHTLQECVRFCDSTNCHINTTLIILNRQPPPVPSFHHSDFLRLIRHSLWRSGQHSILKQAVGVPGFSQLSDSHYPNRNKNRV